MDPGGREGGVGERSVEPRSSMTMRRTFLEMTGRRRVERRAKRSIFGEVKIITAGPLRVEKVDAITLFQFGPLEGFGRFLRDLLIVVAQVIDFGSIDDALGFTQRSKLLSKMVSLLVNKIIESSSHRTRIPRYQHEISSRRPSPFPHRLRCSRFRRSPSNLRVDYEVRAKSEPIPLIICLNPPSLALSDTAPPLAFSRNARRLRP